MKLVLTSGGLTNKSIEDQLREMIGKDFKGVKLLFCTTASNYDGGEMNEWLIKNLIGLKDLGFAIDICDINGIDQELLLPRFEWADIVYFEGGSTQWLRNCIKNSGLEEHLKTWLETKVWIGSSAGSCVLSPTLVNPIQDLFEENLDGYLTDGLGLVDFQIVPHLNNEWFPNITEANIRKESKRLTVNDGKKIYALDDHSAIFVNDKNVNVISEGKWFEI